MLYFVNSKDHYDASKYSADIQGGLETGGLAKGATMALTLPDQFDTSHTIGDDIRTVVIAFSKKAGETVRGYLDKQAPSHLADHKTVFIADISPYPVALRNAVGLPLLRRSKYPVLLIYEDAIAKALKSPQHGDAITVATLESGVVQELRYLRSEAQLSALFGDE